MAEFVRVAATSELAPGQGAVVDVKGKSIALFNVDGRYYAIDDECTHEGGPLSEGDLAGCEVTCPWHGAVFDVTTGAVLGEPAEDAVACYKVRVAGDGIEIEV